jgi:hypothetical protein
MRPKRLRIHPGLVITDRAEVIAEHLGRWVAIVDGSIRASGKNFGEAFEAAQAEGIEDAAEFAFLPRHSFVG